MMVNTEYSSVLLVLSIIAKYITVYNYIRIRITRMWADTQGDGRPAE